MAENMKVFLRFAEGCRCYLDDVGVLKPRDNKAIKSGKPDRETLKRVFYMAYPEMEKEAKRLKKPLLNQEVLRQYYCFRHNRMKHDDGHYACMVFPGYVIGRLNNEYVIELEPIEGAFRLSSKLNLKHGDWVLVHRLNIVEKVPAKFALEVADYLKKLGMGKHLKFPAETMKYLKRLKQRK